MDNQPIAWKPRDHCDRVRGDGFDAGQRRLIVHVDFAQGSRCAQPKLQADIKVRDIQVI
jgi:hypothetical protein